MHRDGQSMYASKRYRKVHNKNGEARLEPVLIRPDGTEKAVSPAGWQRTPVPDVTSDEVKTIRAKSVIKSLPFREQVDISMWSQANKPSPSELLDKALQLAKI